MAGAVRRNELLRAARLVTITHFLRAISLLPTAGFCPTPRLTGQPTASTGAISRRKSGSGGSGGRGWTADTRAIVRKERRVPAPGIRPGKVSAHGGVEPQGNRAALAGLTQLGVRRQRADEDRRVDEQHQRKHEHRRDRDDAPAGLLRRHLLDGELGDVQEALDVRRDERLEVLGCAVRERLGEEDAGVIDQCVDRLEAG